MCFRLCLRKWQSANQRSFLADVEMWRGCPGAHRAHLMKSREVWRPASLHPGQVSTSALKVALTVLVQIAEGKPVYLGATACDRFVIFTSNNLFCYQFRMCPFSKAFHFQRKYFWVIKVLQRHHWKEGWSRCESCSCHFLHVCPFPNMCIVSVIF